MLGTGFIAGFEAEITMSPSGILAKTYMGISNCLPFEPESDFLRMTC